MESVFLTCAIFGGTIMLVQLLLSMLGWGDHGDGTDHDFSGDAHDVGGHDGGHDAAAHDGNQAAVHDSHGGAHDERAHSSTWFFSVITFRTVVAALAFFGLSGMAASTAELAQPLPLVIATACGAAALYGVHYLMRLLYSLRTDGTERIGQAIGCDATVYLPIPANNSGAGKVHFTMQRRLLEYEAVTSGARLPAGTRVVVVGIARPGLLEVEPAPELARNE